jgi:lipoprotein-anchoring transpeptidase ErfK/SrfK
VPESTYNRYRRERRRRRWPFALAALVFALAAVAAWQVVAAPRVSAVTPGPNAWVKSGSPTIVLDVHGLSRLQDVAVSLDGRDVTRQARRDGDHLALSAPDLTDGPHAVSFSATSHNMFRHNVAKSWRFTVDTRVPTLHLDGAADEGRINTSPATFSGTTEAYATVIVRSGALKAAGTADARGAYAVSIDLPDGASPLTITTTDRAGNATVKQLDVFVDAVPPTLSVSHLKGVVDTASPKVRISGHDQLGVPRVKAVLDGRAVHLSGPTAHAVLHPGVLAQGRHVLMVSAVDRGGNVVKSRQTFVVDSTDHFGDAVLWLGARGADVRVLQQRLQDAGVLSGARNGVYDQRTKKAVMSYQERYGMAVDGIVGQDMLNSLSGEIIVRLNQHRLYLYKGGQLVTSYTVATGQPAYPTPTGTFAIVSMTKDPTWLPPNSDWAKTAKPIPPGTENPLGTRWMGTSASGVGIHGVPPDEDGTIGTFASHGCVRMHNWDAVDLFSRVSIGMPVIIRP